MLLLKGYNLVLNDGWNNSTELISLYKQRKKKDNLRSNINRGIRQYFLINKYLFPFGILLVSFGIFDEPYMDEFPNTLKSFDMKLFVVYIFIENIVRVNASSCKTTSYKVCYLHFAIESECNLNITQCISTLKMT